MAQDKDKLFEKVYFLWKGEGEKRNQSIDWYCERYGANIDEFRKWLQTVQRSVKEVQIVGRPSEPPIKETPAASADDAMAKARATQSEPRIVITTSDSGRKPKPAIASLTINLGNGLHMTRKGMSFEEFLSFAQNLKALC